MLQLFHRSLNLPPVLLGKFGLLLAVNGIVPNSVAHTGALEEVVVVSRRPNPVLTTQGVNQGVLNDQALNKEILQRSGDLLSAIPGLVNSESSGSGKASLYYLRGFNLDHGTDFATYVDAMPVNQVSHGHGQGYTDLNFVIPELVAKLDYRKGPFYGDVGDFAGTGMARFQLHSFMPDNMLSLSTGELGYQRSVVLQQVDMGQGIWQLAGESQRYSGPWHNVNEGVRKRNLFAKYRVGHPQNGWDLTLMDYRNQWHSADQIPQRKIADGSLSRWDAPDPSDGGDTRRTSVSWQRQLHNDRGVGYASVYGIRSQLNLWSNFTYFTQPQGDQFYQQDERSTYGGEMKWGFARPLLPGADNRHVFGLQWRQDQVNPVGLYSAQQRQTDDVTREDRVKATQLGLYWQGLWHWSERFTSAVHLRWNHHQFAVKALAAAEPTTLASNSGEKSAQLWTGAWQNTWQAMPSVDLYWHIGRSYHSNDARGVLARLDPANGSVAIGAQALTPVDGSELGLQWQHKAWSTSLALWLMNVGSEQIFIGDAGTTEDSGLAGKRYGLESFFTWAPAQDWLLKLSLNESRAYFSDSGREEIPGALNRIVSFSGNGPLAAAWDLSFSYQFVGRYYLGDGHYAPTSQKTSLKLNYQINDNWSWTLSLLNATQSRNYDAVYWYESQWSDEISPQADEHIHPMAPRQLRLTLRWQYF